MKMIHSIYVGALGDLAYFDVINRMIDDKSALIVVESVELENISSQDLFADQALPFESDHVSTDFYPFAELKDVDANTLSNEKSPRIDIGSYTAAYQANSLKSLSAKNVASAKAAEFLFKYLKRNSIIDKKLAQLIVIHPKEGSGITDYEPAKYATFWLSVDAAVKQLLKGNDISEADRNFLKDDVCNMLNHLYEMAVTISSPMMFDISNRQAIIHFRYNIEDERVKNAEDVLEKLAEFFYQYPEEKTTSRLFDVSSALYTSIVYEKLPDKI